MKRKLQWRFPASLLGMAFSRPTFFSSTLLTWSLTTIRWQLMFDWMARSVSTIALAEISK